MSEIGDGMDHLRIPFEQIKFGKKIEFQGYGSVFEGEFSHRQVALKRLNITNLGHIKPRLFAEILTISRFRQHQNLVALLGFCDEKSNEIILVYEYVSGGNLSDKMRKHLTTIQRLEICLGAARGLDYLHTGVDPATPGIIHGDIKLSKILLNSDSNLSKFEAKVSSFGLSKVLPGQVQKTLRSTDPAYEVTGKVTKESDIYSFGVLLLEVLCGVPELVDTDDYQERHVTELVPKRLEQNRLRKIVHFNIRNEIKTESLEAYAKIACQCVMTNPEDRPTMAQVVEELEKALRLQGGEVSHIQILGTPNTDDATDGTVVEDDGNGLTVDSNILKKEPEDAKIVSIEEDVEDSISDDKSDIAVENNDGENKIVVTSSESSNGEENTAEGITLQEQSVDVPTMHSEDGESVPDRALPEEAQKESSKTPVMSTSNEKSEITWENEDDNQGTTSSESSNHETSTFDHSEANNSGILESDTMNVDNLPYRNQDEEVGGELQHLRIPFEEIKFGKVLEVHGYGSMFEGEFDHRQVALKRLNITNLAHIKPKLLAEALTIYRYRLHPNLVALLGFCDRNSNEIILVYEYVSSGNLADKMRKHLTTIQRLEICLGAARGLDYLHAGVDSITPGIIHGDIKLSKILLNSDSTSSKFEAKVSGFGLSKILPGHVQKTLDPVEVTGKMTKESDIYSFGVVLLEVLCGVPELVDTDDYQERHVTELVPKRLEQNMLRNIVHLDIRNEIETESLETYAKIACQCVMENPKERPTMAQVVVELEKSLRLQSGEVSYVPILRSRNGDGLPEGTIDKDDQKEDGNGDTMDWNIAEKDDRSVGTSSECENGEKNAAEDISTQGQSFQHVPILGSEDGESAPDVTNVEDAHEESGNTAMMSTDHESTKETIADLQSNEEPKIIGDNESRINSPLSESNNGDGHNSALQGSEDGERTNVEDAQQEKDDAKSKEETMDGVNSNEKAGQNGNDKSRIIGTSSDNSIEKNTALEISSNSGILDSGSRDAPKENANSALLNLHDKEKKTELIIDVREGDFDDFATKEKNQEESESKRSYSTCSESSNGDGSTLSDYLLHKSPVTTNTNTVKNPPNGSRNCCSCGWWRFFSDRVAFYGGLFWNKLVSFFTWIKGQFSSKHD